MSQICDINNFFGFNQMSESLSITDFYLKGKNNEFRERKIIKFCYTSGENHPFIK